MQFRLPEMSQEDWEKTVEEMSEDDLQMIATNMVNYGHMKGARDVDGFVSINAIGSLRDFRSLQTECWRIFEENPQINSHVRDFMGTLSGSGFSVSSAQPEVQEVIEDIVFDVRNELFSYMTKFVARSEVEGELFLALTLHKDGFVQVDFLEPTACSGGGDYESGIFFHPNKQTMPIFYCFNISAGDGLTTKQVLIPSIYCAYFPELGDQTIKVRSIDKNLLNEVKDSNKIYKQIGGYRTFVVRWDRSFLTRRNVSHIKTTLKWVRHYMRLKEWEIDHKKSSGSYLWVVAFDDLKSFRNWLALTDDEKRKTGLGQHKTPGGTLFMPPGTKLSCENPKLASISEQDTDIMHMITSGLNRPEDMVTGQTKGDTFSGIKASRGPQADRTKDDIEYWHRFLRYDFWRHILFLRNKAVSSFKLEYKVSGVVGFENKKPKKGKTIVKAYDLINFSFPESEIMDLEAKARAYLGVNHQSIVESLGIPRKQVAKKLGFPDYDEQRCAYQDEEDRYPDLPIQSAILMGLSQKNVGGQSLSDKSNDDQKPGDKNPNPTDKKNTDKKPEVKKDPANK